MAAYIHVCSCLDTCSVFGLVCLCIYIYTGGYPWGVPMSGTVCGHRGCVAYLLLRAQLLRHGRSVGRVVYGAPKIGAIRPDCIGGRMRCR